MDSVEYKKYHEAKMANNNGSSALEIEAVLTTVSFGIFFRLCLNYQRNLPSLYIFVLDFLLIVLPVTLQVTVLSKSTYMIPSIIYAVFVLVVLKKVDFHDIKKTLSLNRSNRKSYISNYRAATNLVSALCILAVDFSLFPRRFAKTETFGFGLMDLGVGYFICANGIVVKDVISGLELMKVIKSSSTLALLGFLRLISVKSASYHEHASEYGIHWNFFFTLAFSKIASYIILLASPLKKPFFLAFISSISHQALLQAGFQEWVFSETSRDSFLSANREGLTSLLGYVSLYFGSVTVGQIINRSKGTVTNIALLIHLLQLCVCMWFCTGICYFTVGVSRRLANVGYIFWIISSSITVMLEFLVFDIVLSSMSNSKYKLLNTFQTPFLMESINSNGLFFFLYSNLITGLINVLFQTFLLGSISSFLLIITYMVIICGTSVALYKNNLILKFW